MSIRATPLMYQLENGLLGIFGSPIPLIFRYGDVFRTSNILVLSTSSYWNASHSVFCYKLEVSREVGFDAVRLSCNLHMSCLSHVRRVVRARGTLPRYGPFHIRVLYVSLHTSVGNSNLWVPLEVERRNIFPMSQLLSLQYNILLKLITTCSQGQGCPDEIPQRTEVEQALEHTSRLP